MTVDNELYNRLSSTWWDENEPLNLLRTSINPGRFGYFRDVLVKQLKNDPRGKEGIRCRVWRRLSRRRVCAARLPGDGH